MFPTGDKYAGLYLKYQDELVLRKARDYSKWTIASLAAEGQQDGKQIITEGDYQSQGATLVSTLASKLVSLLFPSTHPFLRINLSDQVKELFENFSEFSLDDIENDLARVETEACDRLFMNSSYHQLILAICHLIVTGNAAVYRDSESGRTIVYGINSFTVKRDGYGRVVDALIKERTYFEQLPVEQQYDLQARHPQTFKPDDPYAESLEVYTRVLRTKRQERWGYSVTQEVLGVRVGDEGWYPEGYCPWLFPVWSIHSGDSYGRGLVEVHAGDFARYSELSLALTLYQVEALKAVNLASPNSVNDIDSLAEADVGEYVRADPNAVQVFESGVIGKVESTLAMLADIRSTLAIAFMYSGNTRNADRVTAEEIRQAAMEADNQLGGPYSTLSDNLQLPLSYLLISEVDPELLLLLETVQGGQVDITTGINALGRAATVQNIMSALMENAQLSEVLQADNRLDPQKVFDKVYAGRSIDTSTLFKSDQQLQAEQEAEAEMQQAQAQAQQAATIAEQQKMTNDLNVM